MPEPERVSGDAHPARDRFVLERRGPRPRTRSLAAPGRHRRRRAGRGRHRARMATVLLTGRECPWRCAMCDLWTYTTVTDTPPARFPRRSRPRARCVHDRARTGQRHEAVQRRQLLRPACGSGRRLRRRGGGARRPVARDRRIASGARRPAGRSIARGRSARHRDRRRTAIAARSRDGAGDRASRTRSIA